MPTAPPVATRMLAKAISHMAFDMQGLFLAGNSAPGATFSAAAQDAFLRPAASNGDHGLIMPKR